MADSVRPTGRRFVVGWQRNTSWVMALAVCLTVAGPPAGSPAAAALPVVEKAAAAEAAPKEAADEATAMWLAYKHGSEVEILSKRTESSQTFAMPQGSLKLRQSATPQRVRRGAGWVPVRPRLRHLGGAVVPEATTLDVRFAADKSSPLITLVDGDRRVSLSWPYPLPSPTLSDDTATYPEVFPGVDLKLSAGADSVSEVLVVKTREAAQDPETATKLARLRFGLKVNGLRMEQDSDGGFIRAVDPAGKPVFMSDGARMWDSPAPAPPAGSRSRAAADAEPQRIEDIPVRLSTDALTVLPSLPMLTDPKTTFPLFIDPGFNGGKEIWTHVNKLNPNRSYWTDSSRAHMRVGRLWKGVEDDAWRTLVQFDISPLKYATIHQASVLVKVWHTANCNLTPFQLWRTNWIPHNKPVTWNNTRGKGWKRLAEVQASANKHACPKADDVVEFGGKKQAAVLGAFRQAAKAGFGTITFAFLAKNEENEFQWKKLSPGWAYLDINYNHRPGKPTKIGLGPCYKACGPSGIIRSRKPKLTMAVADQNQDLLHYGFQVFTDDDKKTLKADSRTRFTNVKAGNAVTWELPGELPDGRYYWRGHGCDPYGACGEWSSPYPFTVDATNPKEPSVTSEVYPQSGWHGGPNTPGEFVFKPGSVGDGVRTYLYSLNGATPLAITPDSTGVARAIIAPPKDMDNELVVHAVDTAGNNSDPSSYVFFVQPEGRSWYWSLNETEGTTAASLPNPNRPATMNGAGTTWLAEGQRGTAVAFTGEGELTTQDPVLDTTAATGFTVAAWVRLPGPPQVQPGGDGDPPIGPGDSEPEPGNPSGDDPEKPATPPDTPTPYDPAVPVPPIRNQTAVSQDGKETSMFRLGYRADIDLDNDEKPDPAWCFTVKAADLVTAAETTACSRGYLTAGGWTHLVGVVDPATKRIRLYVNGIPARDGILVDVQGEARWQATGSFAIGRAWEKAPAERWVGDIDEVHAVPRVWEDMEILGKAQRAGATPAATP